MLRTLSFCLLLSLFFQCVHATTNNLTELVAWDEYSLSVEGQRIYLYSAEFHYPRLPVPELWLDIFQKIKANGYNAVSLYLFWSFHSPIKDVYDLETGAHDVQRLFDYAQRAGLYVVARAGPYVNAETNAGGFPLYLADGSGGKLRTSDQQYFRQWQAWIAKIGPVIASNSITSGGPVILYQIENELTESRHIVNDTLVVYMEQLKKAYRDAGLTIPTISNEKGMRGQSWSTDFQDVGGSVNIYGLDSYPASTCASNTTGFNVLRTYYQWFQNTSYTQPSNMPEFQGGWFQPWGGSDYAACFSVLDPRLSDVFFKNNIGQRVTMQNHYMTYGGTNWGHSAAPVVYTSYDYSALLSETRQIRDKLSQSKLIGLFTRVSQDLLETLMEGNGTTYATGAAIYTWALRNPRTHAGFYVVQQNVTNNQTPVTFSLDVNTTAGPIQLHDISLDGRQSKIVVTDYSIGTDTLLYSTADIATYGLFNNTAVVVMYASYGQTSTFSWTGAENRTFEIYGAPWNISVDISGDDSVSYTYQQPLGAAVMAFAEGPLVYLLDTPTAWKFWAPSTTQNPNVRSDQQIFVFGPYLVRSAAMEGKTVVVVGDIDGRTSIEVYAGTEADTISWNGQGLPTKRSPYGSLIAEVNMSEAATSIELPELDNWMSADAFPEVHPDYDDTAWTVCNKTSTMSPVQPLSLPVLYSSDYGFHTGIKIYRARFDMNSTAYNITSRIVLTASGGLGFGYNAWVNGKLVGTVFGSPANTTLPMIIDVPTASLRPADNVLTVLVDYHGHDQTSTAYGVANPRGMLGATITGGVFTSWRLQGNAGGAQGAYELDPVRAPMNEGGLLAERLGWHLPGFDTGLADAFRDKTPQVRLNASGVRFFLANFTLNIPVGYDVPIGFELSSPSGTKARVQLFVNGYQFGKYVSHIGPQTKFPVPEGILNHRGVNTVGLSVWSQTDDGASVGVKLMKWAVYQSGFEGFNEDMGEGLRPGWTDQRRRYA